MTQGPLGRLGGLFCFAISGYGLIERQILRVTQLIDL